MNHPLVYEVNTRCWLRELAGPSNARVTLAAVPDAELDRWQRLGFTHIWLLGVWAISARSRACSRDMASLRQVGRKLLPDFSVADIGGSPFAIAGYEVARSLGGEAGLRKFRQRLSGHGLKLMLDFIPNHVGLDHRWLQEQPDLFVQSPAAVPETFRVDAAAGPRWIAQGKDPFFPAWVDTAQLDYRNPATRAAVIGELRRLASRCDGVRCDMAMLVLNDVFLRTWSRFSTGQAPPEKEFWPEAIAAARQENADFLFFAEAYWDLEARLQELGFDYTYDKRLYDHLIARNHPDVRRHLLALPPRFLEAGGHFVENHDEPRVASLLSWPEHQATAMVVLGAPGLRLLQEGQLSGARLRVNVHFERRPVEEPDAAVAAWYEQILTTLGRTAVGRGQSRIIQTVPAWGDNPTWQSFVVIQWQGPEADFDLVVVNLGAHRSQCYARLESRGLAEHNWRAQDLLGSEVHERRGDDLQRQGLYLDVAPQAAQLFHFTATA